MIGCVGAAELGIARSLLPPLPGRSLRLRTAPGRRLVPGAGLCLRTVPLRSVGAETPRVGQERNSPRPLRAAGRHLLAAPPSRCQTLFRTPGQGPVGAR
eukprot:15450204-Alexandrium_andersonii.AAC.1